MLLASANPAWSNSDRHIIITFYSNPSSQSPTTYILKRRNWEIFSLDKINLPRMKDFFLGTSYDNVWQLDLS